MSLSPWALRLTAAALRPASTLGHPTGWAAYAHQQLSQMKNTVSPAVAWLHCREFLLGGEGFLEDWKERLSYFS